MSASECRVELPFPPSVNNLFSQGIVRGKVRRFPSKPYKAWRRAALLLIQAARLPAFSEPVVVKLSLTAPDARPRDADNYAKAVLDALVEMHVLQGDDSRYVKAVVPMWMNDAPEPGVAVEVRLARDVGRPALTSRERRALEELQRKGLTLLSSTQSIKPTIRKLIDAGYVRELPGLFDGAPPQGYVAIE